MSGSAPSDSSAPLYSIPIVDRPLRPLLSRIRSWILLAGFTLFLLVIHTSQLVLYPFSYVPGGLRQFFWYYIGFSKDSFARILVFISRGTVLRITVDEGMDVETLWVMDEDEGRKVLQLGERSVFIANHQVSSPRSYSLTRLTPDTFRL